MNEFEASGFYDRWVSVEMFEHMLNYELILSRIASWMKPKAKLFLEPSKPSAKNRVHDAINFFSSQPVSRK